MKKLVLLLLAFILICSCVSCMIIEHEESYLTFISQGDGTCSVGKDDLFPSFVQRIDIQGEVVIPEVSPEGDRVTTIRSSAFALCPNLGHVTLPNSITEIGDYAFQGCGIDSMEIPDGVTSIGHGVFTGCEKLVSVALSNSITNIGTATFMGCNALKSIAIPSGVTSIGKSAFSACECLTNITIPDSVTSIGDYAFSSSGLTNITFQGTTAEWQAIVKGAEWDKSTGAYTVVCTDGTIAKDGTVTPNE